MRSSDLSPLIEQITKVITQSTEKIVNDLTNRFEKCLSEQMIRIDKLELVCRDRTEQEATPNHASVAPTYAQKAAQGSTVPSKKEITITHH